MHIIKTALLSYGVSGKLFHAPFIAAHPGFQLVGAWERSRKIIQQDYPSAISYPSLAALLSDESIDLVVVNTPNDTHFDYARQALLANKHVVVEKAFTCTVEEGQILKALAQQQQRQIAVYQNRRYDSDFRTVQQVIASGCLGEIVEAEFHFDRYRPLPSPKAHKEIPTPGAGLLMDLGPHLIDAALHLFGRPEALFADIQITRPLSQVDDRFDVSLYYPTKRVRLKAGSFVLEPTPGNVLHGTKGSFLKPKSDPQEADLLAGKKPGGSHWGEEPQSEWGLLHTEKDRQVIKERIPSCKGDYGDFYKAMYEALVNGQPVPVTVDEGIAVMEIIAAAIKSNQQKKLVNL